MSEVAAA
jgi:hypothetical protein